MPFMSLPEIILAVVGFVVTVGRGNGLGEKKKKNYIYN